MSATPPAGWHQDPADPAKLRWWDGKQWTEHTAAAADGVPAEGCGPQGYGSPGSGWDPGGSSPYGPGGYGYGSSSPPPFGGRGRFGGGSSWGGAPVRSGPFARLRAENPASMRAVLYALIYVAIALVTHITILGIVPVLAGIRAMQRRERLAPIALAIAVIPLVLLLLTLR